MYIRTRGIQLEKAGGLDAIFIAFFVAKAVIELHSPAIELAYQLSR
jgi:hypothetical protein